MRGPEEPEEEFTVSRSEVESPATLGFRETPGGPLHSAFLPGPNTSRSFIYTVTEYVEVG